MTESPRKPRYSFVFVILLAVLLSGCRLVEIHGHHWHRNIFGATLFDDTGIKSASVIGGPEVQVCDFEISVSCETFEDWDKAVAWLVAKHHFREVTNARQ